VVARLSRNSRHSGSDFFETTDVRGFALPAKGDAAKCANNADEGTAVRARVAFGGTLLVAARSANHCVSFAKHLAHTSISFAGRGRRDPAAARLQESTSRSAFHNALGCLEPCRHSVRSGFCPTIGHRSEPSLLAFTLETEPAVAEFRCDGNASSKGPSAPLRSSPPVECELHVRIWGRHPPVDLSPLCRRGRHEPYFPPLARAIEKSPITHRQVLRRRYAPRSVLTDVALQGGCHCGCQFRIIGRKRT
jgi:hypothetical protein